MSGEGGSNVYGALGAKFGAGAAKVGKKAAQSEAGRSAGKAAIKGATDSAQKDLTDRYLQQGGATAPAPAPTPASTPKETAKPQESAKDHSSSTSATHSSSDSNPFSGSYSQALRFEGQHHKASFFSKFKPSINTHHKSSKAPARPRPRGERVYKHRLAKEADWDQLSLAQALYNFKGELKCDLEFRKGQVIQVVTRTDKQFDWWEGKIDGRVGIFPANYVKLL